MYLVFSQMVSHDIVKYPYAWFYNTNDHEIATVPTRNETHVCTPIKPKVTTSNIFLMIIIASQALKEDKREAIRETWAKELENQLKKKVYLMFVFGCTRSVHLDRDIDREARNKPNILRVALNEGENKYEIRSLIEAYRFAAKYKPQFLIKIQDNVYVYLPKLIPWLNDRQKTSKLYAGRVHTKVQVTRDSKSKYYVSEQEYASGTFPGYCSGAFYILSGDLFQEIMKLESKVKKFNVEDAFVGVLVSKLGIEPTDISNGVTHIDERTVHELQSWSNHMFTDVFAIGYNLPPNMLQYIHDRYRKILYPNDSPH